MFDCDVYDCFCYLFDLHVWFAYYNDCFCWLLCYMFVVLLFSICRLGNLCLGKVVGAL